MNTQDGRKIGPKAMGQIRIRAVQHVQDGESPEEVILTLGFSRAFIYNWLARYRNGGWAALKTGKQSGRPSKLTGSPIAWIYSTVKYKDPQQLKLPFALWKCSMVAEVIKKTFGIKLSISSVSRFFRQLGLSPTKALAPGLSAKSGTCFANTSSEGFKCPNGYDLEDSVIQRRNRAPIIDYRCKKCGKVFNVFTGTSLQGTKYNPLQLIKCMDGISREIPINRLAKEIGPTPYNPVQLGQLQAAGGNEKSEKQLTLCRSCPGRRRQRVPNTDRGGQNWVITPGQFWVVTTNVEAWKSILREIAWWEIA